MKLAIIGLGMAARAHTSALEAIKDRVEVTGLYMRNQTRREASAEAMQTRAFDSIEAIAQDTETEAVLVMTPPSARKEIITKLAAAGKHILLEKPIERDLAAAQDIVQIAKSAGVKMGMVFQHRTRAGSRALSDILNAGKLGDIAMVRVDVPWWRGQDYYDQPGRGTYAQDGGGVLMTQAIHVLDLMISLVGPVRTVQAMLATTRMHKMEAEDFATAGLVFASGAVGSICTTTAGFPGASEQIRIDGTLGSAILGRGGLTIHWQDGSSEHHDERGNSGSGADPMAFSHEWHQAIIENFADALEKDTPLYCTGVEALEVQRLIEGLVKSSNADGLRVDLTTL